ncbi:hypothetical protein LSAT2_004337, partial [Lamellibrachia satsuma]
NIRLPQPDPEDNICTCSSFTPDFDINFLTDQEARLLSPQPPLPNLPPSIAPPTVQTSTTMKKSPMS